MAQTARSLLAMSALIVASAGEVRAGLALDITFGIPVSPAGATVGGWKFKADVPLIVEGLGFFDEAGDGLDHPHQVGLWNASGRLLADATIDDASKPAASTLVGGRWLFTSVERVLLLPGEYVVGATFLDEDADGARVKVRRTTMPGLTYLGSMQKMDAPGLEMPDMYLPDLRGGIFGPNLLAVAAPEPSSSAGAILGSLVLIRKRRRTADRP